MDIQKFPLREFDLEFGEGGERAGAHTEEAVTGDEAEDREVTLLPEGEGASGTGEGVRERAGAASTLTGSLLLPRMWSMPKLRRPLQPTLMVGEDIVGV